MKQLNVGFYYSSLVVTSTNHDC